MNKKTHRIAADVKADILKRIKEEGVSVADAAKEHGVHESTIYSWLGTGASSSPSWAEYSKLKRERDELLRLVGELTVKLSTTQKKSW